MPLVSLLSNYLSSHTSDSHPEVRFSGLKIHFQHSSNKIGQRDTSLVILSAQMFERDKFRSQFGNTVAFILTTEFSLLSNKYP